MKSTDYTISVTNFARPEHLRRCLESVKNIPNVVVACYGAGDEHRAIINEVRPGTRCYVTEADHGENRLLMQAVALADTPWVVILHDDDQLTPDFAQTLDGINPGDAGFIGWDGLTEWFDGRPAKKVTPWGSTGPGRQLSAPLVPFVTRPHSGMVQSPVTMMLRKDLALAVLSWCEEGLKEFHTRPTMMIGNEIALLFGHLKEYPTWFHIAKPLVKFGHWEGSETVKWVKGENPELIKLYDGVRSKFGAEQFLFRRDRIAPILVHAYTTGGKNSRQPAAHATWRAEHAGLEKAYLIVPLEIGVKDVPRTSSTVGDPRKLPFVKDLMAKAISLCHNAKDIVVFTNDDICIAEGALTHMVNRARELGSTYSHRRDFYKKHLASLGLESITRPLTPEEVAQGYEHAGTDAVLMTREWWEVIGEKHFPDFIIGCEAWDTIIIQIMRMSGSGWGWRNATYHENHGGWWEMGTHRFGNPGQIHNRRVAKEFLVSHCIYRGEFEPGAKKDPAYPRRPLGCDTHPNEPTVKYIGDPNGFVPVKPAPKAAAPEVPAAPIVIKPSRVHPSHITPAPTLERAIVYPYNAAGAKWQELRFSLRGLARFFADTDCPIYILGTKRPHWLRNHPRIIWQDAWSYREALARGVNVAKKVLWMNDDIVPLRRFTWEDAEVPRYLGNVPETVTAAPNNPWQAGMVHMIADLRLRGFTDLKVFSTHTPYVYRRDEALRVFEGFGIWDKMPFEMAYFTLHGEGAQPIGGLRTQSADFGDAMFLNYHDGQLTPALKTALKDFLPEREAWESEIEFIC